MTSDPTVKPLGAVAGPRVKLLVRPRSYRWSVGRYESAFPGGEARVQQISRFSLAAGPLVRFEYVVGRLHRDGGS